MRILKKFSNKISQVWQKNVLLRRLIIFLVIFITFLFSFKSIYLGGIKLWYDDARDLMLAWDNLHKLTLIGPPSGISGIFYGPYWIWLLSIGMLFSKDPRVITFLVATLPYFVIFPLVWFQFRKFFGILPVMSGWILFMCGVGATYTNQLWNPYPAPLLIMVVMYLLLIVKQDRLAWKNISLSLLIGVLTGLVINFHISFGVVFTLGIFVFLIWSWILEYKRHKNRNFLLIKLAYFIIICFGIFLTLSPFFLFEVRHGFNQIKTILHNFGGTVAYVKGLTKFEIFQQFIDTFGKLIYAPSLISGIVLFSFFGYLVFAIKRKKIILNPMDKKVLMLFVSIILCIALVYFSTKNPIWSYHFIGVDIIFLLFLTFMMAKFSVIRWVMTAAACFVILVNTFYLIKDITSPSHSYLQEQENVVKIISNDAKGSEYFVYAYSPATYNYEYAYLFRWLANKDVPFDPSQNPQSPNTIYLIAPDSHVIIDDFIHYRSPDTFYKTVKSWSTSGTLVMKRIKK